MAALSFLKRTQKRFSGLTTSSLALRIHLICLTNELKVSRLAPKPQMVGT